jgi:hypothetical protein
VGTIFHLTARVRYPFPVSIASLEEHLESVVIVPTSLEKATATSPTTPALIPNRNSASSTTLDQDKLHFLRIPVVGCQVGEPAQLVGTLLLVGLALHFIWWLVAGAVVVGGVWSKSGRSTPLAMLSTLRRPEPPR